MLCSAATIHNLKLSSSEESRQILQMQFFGGKLEIMMVVGFLVTEILLDVLIECITYFRVYLPQMRKTTIQAPQSILVKYIVL